MAGRLVAKANAQANLMVWLRCCIRQASLREDYLNQVQRDFLSRSSDRTATPLADATFVKVTGIFYRRPKRWCSRLDVVVYCSRVFCAGFKSAAAPKAASVAS